ncbi:nucleotidyltransferase family protein [Altererythrobacter sp. CAU 1778]
MSRPEPKGCHAVVLAAGAARRFNGAKLLAPVRGRPLVQWPTAAALASGVESVTVVLGARAQEVEEALRPLAGAHLSVVTCANWQNGLSASLQCGVATLPPDARAVLVFLGDMPSLDAGLADRVLHEVLRGAPAAFPVVDDKPGHPVALSRALFPDIARLRGDQGARKLLEKLDGVVRIQTDDEGCLLDIDTAEDLAHMVPPPEAF